MAISYYDTSYIQRFAKSLRFFLYYKKENNMRKILQEILRKVTRDSSH